MCGFLKNNLDWLIPLTITTIFSIFTTVFSILNIRIVRQQKKLQNDSFCFQLFERRLEVYTSLKTIISSILADGAVPRGAYADYLQKSREVDFLFGSETTSLCEDIRETIAKLHRVEALCNSPSKKGQMDSDLVDEETKLLDELSNESKQLHDMVLNYISFSNYKII